MWRLERALAELCGLPHVSLQPSAGSHGELAGLLLTRAYHEDAGEHRHKVLTPDTAHGTNPATVTMAGYEVVKVATDERGGVDLDDLREKASEDVASLMLTNPNTLGLFDENIDEIAAIVHGVGGTLYYDGANLNAIMGWTRPGDMGFDIVHLNLHKSFSQPHGGGGPGPARSRSRSGSPRSCRCRGSFGARAPTARGRATRSSTTSRSRSAGCAASRGTSASSCAPTPTSPALAATGSARPRDRGPERQLPAGQAARGRAGKHLPLAFERRCMHEFVLSGAPAKRDLDVKTLDVAKRLLDYGFHPPTIYFPLLVDEALMVEPTETETRESLDALAEAFDRILAEAERDPQILREAPYTTPVRRLDEAAASRRPIIRQPLD